MSGSGWRLGVTDMRRGMNGLSLQVREAFGRDPHAGDLYVFRGRGGDLIKILWHDGLGLSLYCEHLPLQDRATLRISKRNIRRPRCAPAAPLWTIASKRDLYRAHSEPSVSGILAIAGIHGEGEVFKERGIVNNRPTLSRWIENEGFPPGRRLGPNTRVWEDREVEEYVASRPAAKKEGVVAGGPPMSNPSRPHLLVRAEPRFHAASIR
jgi:hypothetical protein